MSTDCSPSGTMHECDQREVVVICLKYQTKKVFFTRVVNTAMRTTLGIVAFTIGSEQRANFNSHIGDRFTKWISKK